jgi:hypothetical protein
MLLNLILQMLLLKLKFASKEIYIAIIPLDYVIAKLLMTRYQQVNLYQQMTPYQQVNLYQQMTPYQQVNLYQQMTLKKLMILTKPMLLCHQITLQKL